jgi:RND family efflux transporter MFP subunit
MRPTPSATFFSGSFLLFSVFLCGCDPTNSSAQPSVSAKAEAGASFDVEGRTQCLPGRKAVIAPTPLHPVVEVLVKPGDRVKKDQALVKLDDDEPQADVRNKKALLEAIGVTRKEAMRYLGALEKGYASGAVPEVTYHVARAAALKAEHDERAAKAAVESAEAELEHYTAVAGVDGVVAWLDVHVGSVSRPGTTVWGEILDLSEIDVRCMVSPDQADQVVLGQSAAVQSSSGKTSYGEGRVVLVGIAADHDTGRVPVIVRLPNSKGRLRCDVPVKVSFKASEGK